MKLYLPTNPLWYFAVLVIVVPFFVLRVIEPAWLVRLVFIVMLYVGAIAIGLYFILTASRTIEENAPLVKRYGKRAMVLIFRIFLSVFLIVIGLPVILPLSGDIFGVIKKEFPVKNIHTITHSRGDAFSWFFSETIILNNSYNSAENTFSAMYFPLRYLEIGKTYEFLYLPNSRIILDARLVP